MGPPTIPGGKPTFELDMTDTGCCLVAAGKSKYQGPDIVQSCKEWQRTFFYVKSPKNGPDLLNLPEFSVTRPTDKYQWALRYGVGDVDVDQQVKRVGRLERDGLMPNDLAAAWLHARIVPLQRRVHRICDLSGPRDPTRLSTFRIKMEDLCRRLRDITNGHLPEPYHFGLMYLTRREKPRWVCADCIPDFLPIRLFFKQFFLVQHFIQSSVMEDGQEAGKFAPDREVDDPTDFEFNGGPPIEPAGAAESSADNSDSEESDDDAEADSADDDADPPPAARGGTPTSSFEQFLAEWSDDDGLSKLGGPTAVHQKPPKVPAKRAAAASSSSANAPRKTAKTAPPATTTRLPTGQAQASRTKTDKAPKNAPLNVAPLRFRLPTGAPKSAGYVLLSKFCYS